MNSYLLRRLLPFFIFNIGIELCFMLLQVVQNAANFDFSFFAVVKTLGVLLLTSSVSFLFVMQAYVFYLLILPHNKQNSRLDRIITTATFFIFAVSALCKGAVSQIFWEEFSSSFNYIVIDYIIFTHQVLGNLEHAYPIAKILIAIFVAAIIFTLLAYRWLFTEIKAPTFGRRLFQSIIYGMVCILAYININVADMEISPNSFNDEIAKEGTFSLFNSLHKNEIEYDKFYLTNSKADNLQILQKIFGGKNITFINPKKTITRQISSFKPEKRANVVLVIMRGISSEHLNAKDKGYIPNLQKLSTQSLYFPNTYATTQSTFGALEAIDLSLPPLPGLSLLGTPNNQQPHGLGVIFKSKGYDTKWIYASYGVLDQTDKFLAESDFEILDRSKWQKGDISYADLLSASDEDLYNKALSEADKSFAADKPFFSLLLTSSNRYPYSLPDSFTGFPETANRRQKAVIYSDYAIGQFIEKAKDKPWFDNTIFVFVADRASRKSRLPDATLETYKIPLLIYAPKLIKARQINTEISQIDVAPTILGLLNFNYESSFYGADALGKDYISRLFFSRWQKIGYKSNNIEVRLIPGKEYSVTPQTTSATKAQKYLDEAIAFYQQAAQSNNLSE